MEKKCKILLVDDERDILTILKKGLEKHGFDVDEFSDPKIALANFRAGQHDLLILDVRMPGLSGIELFREIRKADPNVKVMFLTAFEIQEKEWQTVLPHTNANGFIKKPVSIDHLINAISEVKTSNISWWVALLIVQGSATDIANRMQTGGLLEPGGHNMLVYESLPALRHIFATYASTFLPQNEIVLLATQYDAMENIKHAIMSFGIDVSMHLDDGTLFIIDAQNGYQGADSRGTYKLAMSLIARARKEGRRGVTWMGDMGSFFAFHKIEDMVRYELSCPTKLDDILKAMCCYHVRDYLRLGKKNKDRLEGHHFKIVFAGWLT